MSSSVLPVAPTTSAKFDLDGNARRYPGITVITDLAADEATRSHLADVSDALAGHAVSAAHAFLPSASLHMTLFRGVNDQRRNQAEWPNDLPLDLPLHRIETVFTERLSGCALPYRFRMRPMALAANATGELQLSLTGVDADEDALLEAARAELSTRLRLRTGETDYRFHVTLSYRVRPADAAAERELGILAIAAFKGFAAQCPVLTVEAPTLSTYENMLSFHKGLLLSSG